MWVNPRSLALPSCGERLLPPTLDGCIYLSPGVPPTPCCSALMRVIPPPSRPGRWVYLPLARCSAHALLLRPHVGELPLPPGLGGECIYLSPGVPPTPCSSALIRVSAPSLPRLCGGCIYLSPGVPPTPCCSALMRVSTASLPPWVVCVLTSRPVCRPRPAAPPSCG